MSERELLVPVTKPGSLILLLDCTELTASPAVRAEVASIIESNYSGDIRKYLHFDPQNIAEVMRLMDDLREYGHCMFKEVRVFGTRCDKHVQSLLGLCHDLGIPIKDHTAAVGDLRIYLRWGLQINRSPTRK